MNKTTFATITLAIAANSSAEIIKEEEEPMSLEQCRETVIAQQAAFADLVPIRIIVNAYDGYVIRICGQGGGSIIFSCLGGHYKMIESTSRGNCPPADD